MRKAGGMMSLIFLLVIIIFAVYVYWDNNRFIVVEQDIHIDDLPEQLQDFRILQISDLHVKQFGHQQSELIEAINDIDYDAIVFTGDMQDDKESTDYGSFYSLIEGIDDKETAWFVPGNTDPNPYDIDTSVEKSDFIRGMEARGVQLLESMETVTIDDYNVHFVHFELSIIENPEFIGRVEGIAQPDDYQNEKYQAYQARRWEELKDLDDLPEADVVVSLNHYPIPDPRVDYIKNHPELVWPDDDLILAGHYHGGQIRLPLIGALFVPEPWYEPNRFFPPQDRVKGLWTYGGTKQYVSAGLGSSDAIPLVNFRLFNPPEINVLTFR